MEREPSARPPTWRSLHRCDRGSGRKNRRHGVRSSRRARSISGPRHYRGGCTATAFRRLQRLERVTTILVGLVTCTRSQRPDPAVDHLQHHPANIGEGSSWPCPRRRVSLSRHSGITGVRAAELFAYPYWCIEKGTPTPLEHGHSTRIGSIARGWTGSCSSTPGSAWWSSPWRPSPPPPGCRRAESRGLDPKGPDDPDVCRGCTSNRWKGLPGPLHGIDSRGFLLGALGGPVQDVVRRHRRQQPDSRPISWTWPASGSSAAPQRDRVVRTFCVVPCVRLSLISPFANLRHSSRSAASLRNDAPRHRGAHSTSNSDADRRVSPAFISDILTWLAFFAISGVAILQHR